jgi:anti-sigma factor ChrR (cupin superfamily)
MTHEMKDLAPHYALGALEAAEALAFKRHLESGCSICNGELDAFQKTVGAMGLTSQPVNPPAHVRDALKSRLSALAFRSIRSDQGEWQEQMPGVLVKQLHVDPATGTATSLVRMLPGTSLPRHRHRSTERFFVLQGDCRVEDEQLGPGDFHVAEAGSIHQSTYTVEGTLLLLVAGECYEFEIEG